MYSCLVLRENLLVSLEWKVSVMFVNSILGNFIGFFCWENFLKLIIWFLWIEYVCKFFFIDKWGMENEILVGFGDF